MRQFYLINGSGNEYSLMDVEHWLYQPSNLGAKFSSKYEQIGGNFIRTNRVTRPDDIKGKILFTGKNKYDDYFEFQRFIAVEPLTLIYVSNDTYKVSVDLKSIDKSEIENGVLSCEIKLKRLSRWYKEITILNDVIDRTGKNYDYTYDYTYTEFERQTATIDSDSGYESPTKITIFGPAINPTWKHYLNGDVIETGKVTADIREGRRLVIDCTNVPYSIKEIDQAGDVKNDLYQFSDFETARFFELSYGRNRITVEHDGTNDLSFAVEARIEYETV